jgi:pimeloyl-ACP methyl ester carboxylesterase
MHCSVRGRGEAVLFIHGMPTNGRLWDDVVSELAHRFQCFVIDLPGMGSTPFLRYSSSYFAQVAAQLETVRMRHHVGRWRIVAHDGGCAVAVQYARLFSPRVVSLALLSPALFPDLRPFFLLEVLRRPVLGELSAPLVHALFWRVAMRRALSPAHHASQHASFLQTFAGIAGPWKLMRLVRWGKPRIVFQEFPSILHDLRCPALILHGSRDILPETFAHRAAALIANAQLVTIDSGHFMPLEQASAVAQLLATHFASHSAQAAPTDSSHPRTASRHNRPAAQGSHRQSELVALHSSR